ncbi:unnamed protein product [Caenorhabditis nigoni]
MNLTNSSIEYPPPPLAGASFAKTAIPYSICFVFGTLGNTAVLSYVFFITRSLKSSVTALGNTFIYIVALCAVDLLVTVSISLSLSNSILNNWVFGELACKIHWMLELSNKLELTQVGFIIQMILEIIGFFFLYPCIAVFVWFVAKWKYDK